MYVSSMYSSTDAPSSTAFGTLPSTGAVVLTLGAHATLTDFSAYGTITATVTVFGTVGTMPPGGDMDACNGVPPGGDIDACNRVFQNASK